MKGTKVKLFGKEDSIVSRYKTPLSVFGIALIGAVLGYAWASSGSKSYTASSTIVFNIGNGSQANPLLIRGLGPTPVDFLAGVLKSRSIEDRIVQSVSISRKDLRDWLVVTSDQKSNQVTVSMNYQPNSKALAVVESAVKSLQSLDREINFSNAKRKMISLEQAIRDNSVETIRAQDRLIAFQGKMKSLVSGEATPTGISYLLAAQKIRRELRQKEYELRGVRAELEQAKKRAKRSVEATFESSSGVKQVDEWRIQLTDKKHELDLKSQFLGPEAPEVLQLRKEVESLTRTVQNQVEKYILSVNNGVAPEISKLEASSMLLQWQVDYLRPLAERAPNEAAELTRLTDEVGTLVEVGRALRVQFENAKIEAKADPGLWAVLDPPALDPIPSNFRPARAAALVGLGFALISFTVMFGMRKRADQISFGSLTSSKEEE